MKRVSIVIPCFNEEDNIKPLIKKMKECLPTGYKFSIIFVDDGSTDSTLKILQKLSIEHPEVQYLSFSRNFGHQYALKAGLDHATGDCVISMDSDLQHPPELIKTMLDYWEQGMDVVYTIRKDDTSLSLFKRKTSSGFYFLFNYFTKLNLEEGVADFRLLDRKVVNVLRDDITEYELFLRGMIKWVGFKQIGFEYTPNQRHAGTSKYSIKKMILFALEGITSFSPKPIQISIYLGVIISIASFIYGVYAIYGYFYLERNMLGWTSIITSILFIGGVQLLFLGILGEYIGRVYLEVKRRPKYIIKENNVND